MLEGKLKGTISGTIEAEIPVCTAVPVSITRYEAARRRGSLRARLTGSTYSNKEYRV